MGPRLGVALEYLLNDFVLEAREATCLHDPTFYVVSAELLGFATSLVLPRSLPVPNLGLYNV